MYSIVLGIAYMLSNSSTVIVGGSGFEQLGSGKIGTIPIQFYFFLGVWAVGHAVLAGRRSGVTSTRSATTTTRRCGPASGRTCCGSGSSSRSRSAPALAGIIVTSELSSAAPQIGDPYLLAVVTAVILGGASLRGGRGSLARDADRGRHSGRAPERLRAAVSIRSTREYIVLGALLIFAVLTDRLVRRADR